MWEGVKEGVEIQTVWTEPMKSVKASRSSSLIIHRVLVCHKVFIGWKVGNYVLFKRPYSENEDWKVGEAPISYVLW